MKGESEVQVPVRKTNPRKLLIASVGVATVNYLGSCTSKSGGPTVANLMAVPAGGVIDAGRDGAAEAGPAPTTTVPMPPPTVANLVAAPPPMGKSRGG